MYLMDEPWVDFDELRKESDLVIVPTGAVEVYGQHMPTGTDTIVATHVAKKVAEQVGAVVLPTVPVGYSRSIGDFPGTLNISPATVTAYVRESVESILQWGMKRVLFINSHRGNINPIGEVAMDLQDKHGARCAQVFWWDYVNALVKDVLESGQYATNHASEVGTSVMLHIAPELVKTDRIVNQTPDGPLPFSDITQYKGMGVRSKTGVVGNPEVASAEKGEIMVQRGVDRIVDFIRTDFGG